MQHFYFRSALKITPSIVAAGLAIPATDVLVESQPPNYHVAVPDGVSVTSAKKQAILSAASQKEITAAEWSG